MVIAHELGLAKKIDLLPAAANPINRDQTIVAKNPLGKIPALLTDDGTALYDSRVIADYLNHLGGGSYFPTQEAARWRALTEQALGDGMLDAALLARYEAVMRPEQLRWADWTRGQMEKIFSGIAQIEAGCEQWGDRWDIGTITLACSLGYLDFRFADVDWRGQFPKAAQWFARVNAKPSMQATLPKA
jgi:glutathione S-transferase